MKFQINTLTFLMVTSTLLLSQSHAYDGDSFGTTITALQNQNIESPTPGINALTKQIVVSTEDIGGTLPYQRNYQTAIQLEADVLRQKSASGKSVDQAFPQRYFENRSKLSAGWSNNYDWGLQFENNNTINIYMPNTLIPLKFIKQSNGEYLLYNTSSGKVFKSEYKIVDNNKNIELDINGMKVYFSTLSGERSSTQEFQATQIVYLGGRKVNLAYSMTLINKYKKYLLTGVSDNRGNSLKITRINMDGLDKTVNGLATQGFVSSVELLPNAINKQISNYSYFVRSITKNGVTTNEVFLKDVNSTMNGNTIYNYQDFLHKGIYQDSKGKISGVIVPVLSNYSENGQIVLNWEIESNLIRSFTDKNIDVASIYLQSSGTLEVKAPGDTSKQVIITNATDWLLYTGDVFSHNGERIERFEINKNNLKLKNVVKKPIRRAYGGYPKPSDKDGEREYDEKGRLAMVKEEISKEDWLKPAEILRTDFVYNTSNNTSIPNKITNGVVSKENEINGSGQITQSKYLSTQESSDIYKVNYSYFDNGLLKNLILPSSKNLNGKSIQFDYDVLGNKLSESFDLNGPRKTSYSEYNSYGKPGKIVYPNGIVEAYIYNNDGTMSSKSVFSNVNNVGNPDKVFKYFYNEKKKLSSMVLPDGEVINYAYDNKGRMIKADLPNKASVHKTYYSIDSKNTDRSLIVKDNLGNPFYVMNSNLGYNEKEVIIGNNEKKYKIHYIYNTNNLDNVIGYKKDIDANIVHPEIRYDFFRRPIATVLERNEYVLKYDINNNVIARYDPLDLNQPSSNYQFKNVNSITKEVNKDYGEKKYSYDQANNLISAEWAGRKCSFLNYDNLNRFGEMNCINLISNIGDAGLVGYKYNYDQSSFGNFDGVTSLNNTYGVSTQYSYDGMNRVIGKKQNNKLVSQWSGTKPELSISYGYSKGNKLLNVNLPSGRKVSYEYDNEGKGQLKNIKLDGVKVVSDIGYNGGGQILGWNWGGSNSNYNISYESTLTGFVSSIKNKNGTGGYNYNDEYEYDKFGRIDVIKSNNETKQFKYNSEDRLISESLIRDNSNVYQINYEFDKNGNRTKLIATGDHKQPEANVLYGYQGNKLNSVNGKPISYTPNNEMIFGNTVPKYDSVGNRFSNLTGSDIQPKYNMAYNFKNERTMRGYNENGSAWKLNSVQFFYDEDSRLVGEYDLDGNPLVEYIWMGDKPVVAIYGSIPTGKKYWILTDIINTPRRLIDSNNEQVAWSWNPTAFGVGSPNIELVKFNLRFQGQYYDELSKQFYNINRYYNPQLGRYMEPDPSGLNGGNNPYSYANQNPVMNVDPYGKFYIQAAGALIGGGISLGMNLLMQNARGQGIDVSDAVIAFGIGATAGAVAPWSLGGTASQAVAKVMLMGATANTAQTAISNAFNEKPNTAAELGFSAVAGAAGGLIGGRMSSSNLIPLDTKSLFFAAGEASFRNQQNTLVSNLTTGSLVRNGFSYFSTGVQQSEWMRMNQKLLDINQYDKFIVPPRKEVTISFCTPDWSSCN